MRKTGPHELSSAQQDLVDQAIHRILVLRPGAIGDTLLTIPALSLLRCYYPAAKIDVVGNRPTLRLAQEWGLADAVDAFGAAWVGDLFGDEPTPALRERLQHYDLGIVWMHAVDPARDLAARLEVAGVRRAVPLVSFPATGSQRHVADHLVDTLVELGISEPQALLAPSSPPRIDAGWDASNHHRLAVLHPGAGARRKRWPAERYAELGERLIAQGYSLAVTSGPADEEAVATLQASLRQPIQLLAGLDLRDLAAILARAGLVIGNDSGITHLAALGGVPTVAILGPFDPAYWAPIGPRVAVVDAGRDCTHRQDPRDGCRQCDLLPLLPVDSVWAAVQSLLDPASAD
jgi:heptosyltransferase III